MHHLKAIRIVVERTRMVLLKEGFAAHPQIAPCGRIEPFPFLLDREALFSLGE
jgi:hypothetical protein